MAPVRVSDLTDQAELLTKRIAALHEQMARDPERTALYDEDVARLTAELRAINKTVSESRDHEIDAAHRARESERAYGQRSETRERKDAWQRQSGWEAADRQRDEEQKQLAADHAREAAEAQERERREQGRREELDRESTERARNARMNAQLLADEEEENERAARARALEDELAQNDDDDDRR